jgi:hypothetical protein
LDGTAFLIRSQRSADAAYENRGQGIIHRQSNFEPGGPPDILPAAFSFAAHLTVPDPDRFHHPAENGPQFIAGAAREWITGVGAKTAYMLPGSPWRDVHDISERPRGPPSLGSRGIEFIDENGGGAGVRLRKSAKKEKSRK